MRFLIAFVLVSALGSPLLACDLTFNKLNLCGTLEFANKPTISVDSPFLMTFTDQNGSRVKLPAARLEAELWMPSMGHGSSPTTVVPFSNSGAALVSKVYFIMGGDWEIRVRFYELNAQGKKVYLDQANYSLDL